MNREEQLKIQLLEISKNDWNIPKDIDTWKFALELMSNIGSTDSELRDNLILELLWKLITEKSLAKEQIKELLGIALSDKHLFYKLGEEGGDSVFNRAFTVLIVNCIVYYHNNLGEELLNEKEMLKVFDDVIRYVSLEKDTRGYVNGKGWAHAIAHSGDCLRELALCSYIKHDQLLEILKVVKEKICISYYTYINEEAERLVSAIMNAIERKLLSDEEVIDWIKSFGGGAPTEFPAKHYWKENVKNLLRSLYFRLKFQNGPVAFINEIEQVQYSINRPFTCR